MNPLIMQGIQLMAVGMGTVFSFLTLLIFATAFMSRCIACLTPTSMAPREANEGLDQGHVAAITAAIAKFENDKLDK